MSDSSLPTPDERPPAAPRWVRVFAILAAAFVLVFVILHLAGGGFRNHMH